MYNVIKVKGNFLIPFKNLKGINDNVNTETNQKLLS